MAKKLIVAKTESMTSRQKGHHGNHSPLQLLCLLFIDICHRSPPLLQPAVHRAGHRLTCRRVLDRYLQHQHVHLRDRSRLHPDGACHLLQDEGDHRLHQRGQHHGAGYCFFKKWANPGLFFIYFRLFQTQITIFTTN